jgi:tetratricopeptide (TPR) repeat protein
MIGLVFPPDTLTQLARHKKLQQKPVASGMSKRMQQAMVIAVLVGFFVHARHFLFIQDDAFITFRYIKNLVAGNGLVWNTGERVEGYTTFLWTVLLALPAKLGMDLVPASQNAGLLVGLASVYLLYRISGDLAPKMPRPFGFMLIAPALLAANSAVAYWAISGMETALFMFLTLLAIRLYLKERKRPGPFAYAPLVFVLLSYTRPEGMFLFGLTAIHFSAELYRARETAGFQRVKRFAVWAALYLIPTCVFMIWRLMYYGYLFPNTFYAKTGFSEEYLLAGLDYFWVFAQKYLFWGSLLVLPLIVLFRRVNTSDMLYLVFIVLSYTAYTIMVGGDVLPAFRFFVPMLPLIYLFVQEALVELHRLAGEARPMLRKLVFVIPLVLVYVTYKIPYDYVREFWVRENGLVVKMTEIGKWIKANSSPNSVVAASTIGAIGYYCDVTLVDMLGLTDETIAHHPETIEGIESGWRERHYNVTYVLSRKPDWICFSTGIKPSAFAERALFTRDEFRHWYYPYYFHLGGNADEVSVIYKRSDTPLPGTLADTGRPMSNDFINHFYAGMNRIRIQPTEAIRLFHKAMETGPPDFALLYESMAGVYRAQNNTEEALRYYARAVEVDPRMIESHIILGVHARDNKEHDVARGHFEQIVKYDPLFSPGWTLLGEIHYLTGDMARARELFQRALQVAPNEMQAYRYLQRIAREAVPGS